MASSEEPAAQQLPNGVNGMNGAGTNGSSGDGSSGNNTNNFSLTEYSAMPSPPSEEPKKAKAKVPEEFLLENGHPDVSPAIRLEFPDACVCVLGVGLNEARDSICASSSPPTHV
jgi:hypothetical protein